MSTDKTQGEWNVIKGKAKRIWAELTDDDLKAAEGSIDKLYGTIQKRFGITKDQVISKISQTHL